MTYAGEPWQAMRSVVLEGADRVAAFGETDFTVFNAGQFPADRYTTGMTSTTSVAINFARREMVLLGSQYAGEMMKGPGDVSLFFGLSGTGKTTLSADPHRFLIGDDEHCCSDEGIFNVEGGCYAKCIGLSAEREPETYGAIRFGSVVENVVYNLASRDIIYDDSTLTENTRCSYPIEFIPNAKLPCVGGHPKNIILLTYDAIGVFLPVAKLSPAQVSYHFISGCAAKIAGTENGVTESQATFSAAPFLHQASAWLINTGCNGGAYGTGKRISIKYSRAIIDAIHSGELAAAEYGTYPVFVTEYDTYPVLFSVTARGICKSDTYPVFDLHIPRAVTVVPPEVLNSAKSWLGTKQSFDATLVKLAGLFNEKFAAKVREPARGQRQRVSWEVLGDLAADSWDVPAALRRRTDAAHGLMPFIGQGTGMCTEDSLAFQILLEKIFELLRERLLPRPRLWA
ncbi:Protein kinase C-like 1, partial [Cladochytrium tenue]